MKLSLKSAVFLVIGSAVFAVLDSFMGINTALPQLQITYAYAFLSFVAVVWGPWAGALTGLLGTAISFGFQWYLDLTTITGNCAYGCLLGLMTREIDIKNGFFDRKEMKLFNEEQIIANIVCCLVLQPIQRMIMNSQPIWYLMRAGIWTCLSRVFSVALLGTLLLAAYAKSRVNAASFMRG